MTSVLLQLLRDEHAWVNEEFASELRAERPPPEPMVDLKIRKRGPGQRVADAEAMPAGSLADASPPPRHAPSARPH